jgi:hypothetical protein
MSACRDTHPAGTQTNLYGLDIEVTGTINILPGGSINADNRGCPPRTAGSAGFTVDSSTNLPTQVNGADSDRGGSYAASIGGSNAVYGSAADPNAPGSSSGWMNVLASGGGLIRIKAAEIINNGTISAKNSASSSTVNQSYGSGGGIKIELTNGELTGSGTITAVGGSHLSTSHWNGGGGRIAIRGNAQNYTGTITAAAGSLATNHGSIYLTHPAPVSLWTLPHTLASGSAIPFPTNTNLVILSGVTFALSNNASTFQSINNAGTLTLGTGSVQVTGNVTNSGTMTFSSGAMTVNGDFTQTAGLLTHSRPTWTNHSTFPRVDITAANITVTGISANGMGLTGGTTAQCGNSGQPWAYLSAVNLNLTCLTRADGRGGNHLSLGGLSTSATWGNADFPYTYGGGGHGQNNASLQGGYGGGIVRLITPGTLTVNGSIDAGGGNGLAGFTGGGGAGGSIYIDATTLRSTNNLGSLSAAGGNGQNASTSHGGAGGLIRVYTSTGTHTGTIVNSVAGGGTVSGTAGAAGSFLHTACNGTYLTNGLCLY